MPKPPSDRRIRFYGPILDALRQLGGSGKPREVESIVFAVCGITDDDLAKQNKNGGSNVRNEFHWARDYLRRLGLLDGSEYGVWRLTEEGTQTTLTLEQARQLKSRRTASKPNEQLPLLSPDSAVVEDESETIPTSLTLLETSKALPSAGFEKLCQRLLREAEFDKVEVTGGSGDGGIDGHGVLRVNEFVTFRVVFQCKRYAGSVGPDKVRDFRGGIRSADTDKAILLSTGTYTRSAWEEAAKPGLFPIELVDGDRLVELMERLQLGVRPRTVFDVDERFFDEYR